MHDHIALYSLLKLVLKDYMKVSKHFSYIQKHLFTSKLRDLKALKDKCYYLLKTKSNVQRS